MNLDRQIALRDRDSTRAMAEPAWDVCKEQSARNALRYNVLVIRSFHDKETERIWAGEASRRWDAAIQSVARRKLRMLNNAAGLRDLLVPPANRLEALNGDRKGQHSIRVNDQFRLCFVWAPDGAHDVKIVDYH